MSCGDVFRCGPGQGTGRCCGARPARGADAALARRPRESRFDIRIRKDIGKSGRDSAACHAPQMSRCSHGRALCRSIEARTPELYPPLVGCKAAGGPGFFNAPGFEIVDVPELKSIFILNIAGPHSWRVIYMDGGQHPTGDALRPTYLGHSIGRWEGDTLVIDTVGFNEKQWLAGSMPTTDKLHLIERISRPNLRSCPTK